MDDLIFRAGHKGYSPKDLERAARQGIKLDDMGGTLIQVTPGELESLFNNGLHLDLYTEATELADAP